MSTVLYFAYGSNLDEDQLQARCPSARSLFRARLRHHRLDFTHFSSRWRGGAADVVAHFGETVWGLAYELDEADLGGLDRYEGGYERVLLTIEDDEGRALLATTYSVRSKRTFLPTRVYRDKLVQCGERWSLPPDYLTRIRTMKVVP